MILKRQFKNQNYKRNLIPAILILIQAALAFPTGNPGPGIPISTQLQNSSSKFKTDLITSRTDSTGYLSVGTISAAILGYSMSLIIFPTSLVLMSLFLRLNPEETPESENAVERSLKLIETYSGIVKSGRNCFRKMACNINSVGREKTHRGFLLR